MLPPNVPSDVTQKRLLKALSKIGFQISYYGGNGSHVKAIDPKSNKFLLIQFNIHKQAFRSILKSAESLGYNAQDIIDNI